MRHSFRFPEHIRRAVREYVDGAVAEVSPQRYNQEAPYTAALALRLEGVVYNDTDGYVEFISTIVDDRGRDSAESWAGADWAITADISDTRNRIEKAILLQVKLGQLDNLNTNEEQRLQRQVRLMKRHTRAPKVVEIVESNGRRMPRVVSGNRLLEGAPYRSYNLGSYFTARVLTTHDGDTRPEFVAAVQESPLTQLKVIASASERAEEQIVTADVLPV